MPESPTPRLTFGELARAALAADRPAERHRLVGQLAKGTTAADQAAAVAELFLAGGRAGRTAFLEWFARLRVPLAAGFVERVVPLLSERRLPVHARVVAAARVLRCRPDTVEAVRPVTRALTAKLSPFRGLERLRHLQHQVDESRALDSIIDRREQRVKMDCPRCGVRLPRVAMVKHLWHEHRLLLDRGKTRSPQRAAEDIRAESPNDPAAVDRTAILAGEAGLRAWLAATDPQGDDAAGLRAAAADHDAGLCPGCLAELPRVVAPLPPPLVLANGRLAGGGYEAAVGGPEWLRTLTVASPRHLIRYGPDPGRSLGPRGAATLAALPVLVGAVIFALVVRPSSAPPFLVVAWLLVAAGIIYGAVRLLRKPLPPPGHRAIDAAWAILARRLLDRDLRWLTRLCLTSPGRGDPTARTGLLNALVERARAAAEESDEAFQLLAAARVLQVEDAARHGRDRVAGIAGLVAPALKGELPADFAEHVAGCFLTRDPPPEEGDLARLRVLLLDAAFEAGLKPRDLLDLWSVAPNFRRVTAVEPLHRLGFLHGVWRMRTQRRWERVAAAETVFDLCRQAPNVSGRVLARFPDTLLVHRPDPAVDAELGPVLVCARGVVVGGQLAADPDAELGVEKVGGFLGGYELVIGRHRIRMNRRPPDEFLDTVRGWLKFRAAVLLPLIDRYLEPGPPEVLARVLAPFCRKCKACGTVSAVAVGKVGVPVR